MAVFFRDVEIAGVEHVPRDAPLLIVSNHTNALIDPLLLLGHLPVHARLLAKSTLWDLKLLAPLLRLGAAIPVFRRQDAAFDAQGEQHTARNEGMFAHCHEVLASGGSIALFPEGISHNEPKLMPLKTGVARIALEAEIKYPNLGIRIVPVGLIFDARTRFRSRALLQVGEPIDPTPELDRYRRDPRQAVSRLTARVAANLSEITPNYTSWEEARLAQRAAEIIANDPLEDPRGELPLSKHAALSKALFDGYRLMREREPLRVAHVYDRVKSYDHLLRVFRLRSRQITSSYGWAGAAGFTLHSLAVLVIRLPLTLIGIVLNYLPYRVIGVVAMRKGDGDNDIAATYKVLGGFFLFPLTWSVEAVVAAWLGGLAFGGLVLVLAPATAWIAMRSHDRRRHLYAEARAFLLLRNNRRIAEELGRRRDEIVVEIEALAARLRRDAPTASSDARARWAASPDATP